MLVIFCLRSLQRKGDWGRGGNVMGESKLFEVEMDDLSGKGGI